MQFSFGILFQGRSGFNESHEWVEGFLWYGGIRRLTLPSRMTLPNTSFALDETDEKGKWMGLRVGGILWTGGSWIGLWNWRIEWRRGWRKLQLGSILEMSLEALALRGRNALLWRHEILSRMFTVCLH